MKNRNGSVELMVLVIGLLGVMILAGLFGEPRVNYSPDFRQYAKFYQQMHEDNGWAFHQEANSEAQEADGWLTSIPPVKVDGLANPSFWMSGIRLNTAENTLAEITIVKTKNKSTYNTKVGKAHAPPFFTIVTGKVYTIEVDMRKTPFPEIVSAVMVSRENPKIKNIKN